MLYIFDSDNDLVNYITSERKDLTKWIIQRTSIYDISSFLQEEYYDKDNNDTLESYINYIDLIKERIKSFIKK